jgi:hypothetical protein
MTENNGEPHTDGAPIEKGEVPEAVAAAIATHNATRSPAYDLFDQSLCTHIYYANNSSDQLFKIAHTIEAARMVIAHDKNRAKDFDVEKIKVIRTVCYALTHAIKTPLQNKLRSLVCVRFGFEPSEENYKKYLEPWNPSGLRFFHDKLPKDLGMTYRIFHCASCRNEVGDDINGWTHTEKSSNSRSCAFCGASLDMNNFANPYPTFIDYGMKRGKNVSEAAYNIGLYTALSEDSYVEAINAFLMWIDEFIVETLCRVMEGVKTEIYSEVVKLYQQDREEKKNGL